MSDRKRYSKTREAQIRSVIDRAIVDLRIAILRGSLETMSGKYQEAKVFELTKNIANDACAEYRKSYAKQK